MASVNQTQPHCVNQMGKTHSKPLAARQSRGTAWARQAMCESALMFICDIPLCYDNTLYNICVKTQLYFDINIVVLAGTYFVY